MDTKLAISTLLNMVENKDMTDVQRRAHLHLRAIHEREEARQRARQVNGFTPDDFFQ